MIFWLALFILGPHAGAETYSAKRLAALPKLIRPEKITVGPQDQFQAAVSAQADFVIYTAKADLVAHLEIQDLNSGKASHLIALDADSQDASLSASDRLAFTYYKFDARGDICYTSSLSAATRELAPGALRCLKRPENERGSERSSPFWKSKDEIGYVTRDPNTQNTRVVAQNIDSGKLKVLAEGKVWAPAMREGGHLLVFSAVDPKGKRELRLLDLRTGEARALKLDLPGIPGFSTFSADEEYVYFSHFLEDTNDDNAIDGGDNAVVFRVPTRAILTGHATYPEQLTAIDESCSFPRVEKNQLFVTCAFDGSLDLYRLPASGIIPPAWDIQLLHRAYASSRSYAERLVVLNALKSKGETAGIYEALFNNFLLLESPQAAAYYLERTTLKNKAELKLYLEAMGLGMSEPPGEISRALENALREVLQKLSPFKSQTAAIVRASVKADLQRNAVGFDKLTLAPDSPRVDDLLWFKLAERLNRLDTAYDKMIRARALTAEDRIYYGFNFLRHLEVRFPELGPRLKFLSGLRGLPEDVAALVQAEITDLKIVEAKEKPLQQERYADLDGQLTKQTKNYFLRKAMNIRAIQIFGASGQFQFMNAVAAAWLRDTAMSDTEFIYAREAIMQLSRDEGYADYNDKKWAPAAAYFYGALSLTDDLESDAGYILASLKTIPRAALDKRYDYLVNHGAIEDNIKYVEALLAILDGGASGDSLDNAITKLDQMTTERDSAVRYLLLGYAYLAKMRKSAIGLEIDDTLLQKAARNLNLAYDQGRDNDRVRAAAAMNLGLLHQRSGNYGLSARDFALRKRLGFESDEANKVFSWFYAKSLFHTYQSGEAAKELLALPKAQQTPEVREREAFYLNFSGQSAAAAKLYAELPLTNDLNRAKVGLAQGYALFRSKDFAGAKSKLQMALAAAARLKPRPKDATHILDFDPVNIKLNATGLLGQIGTAEEKRAALSERARLLSTIKDTEEARILNANHLAALLPPTGARGQMRQSLDWLEVFARKNGYLGQTVSRDLENHLAQALMHPDLYRADKKLEASVAACRSAMAKEKSKTIPLQISEVKLALLWQGYQRRLLRKADGENVLAMASAVAVKQGSPGAYTELEQLARTLAGL